MKHCKMSEARCNQIRKSEKRVFDLCKFNQESIVEIE